MTSAARAILNKPRSEGRVYAAKAERRKLGTVPGQKNHYPLHSARLLIWSGRHRRRELFKKSARASGTRRAASANVPPGDSRQLLIPGEPEAARVCVAPFCLVISRRAAAAK